MHKCKSHGHLSKEFEGTCCLVNKSSRRVLIHGAKYQNFTHLIWTHAILTEHILYCGIVWKRLEKLQELVIVKSVKNTRISNYRYNALFDYNYNRVVGRERPMPVPLPTCLKVVASSLSSCPANPVPPFSKTTNCFDLQTLLQAKQLLSCATNWSAHFLQNTCPHELTATSVSVFVKVTEHEGHRYLTPSISTSFFSWWGTSVKMIGKRSLSLNFSLPWGQQVSVEGAWTLSWASGVADGSQKAFIVRKASSSYAVTRTLLAPWNVWRPSVSCVPCWCGTALLFWRSNASSCLSLSRVLFSNSSSWSCFCCRLNNATFLLEQVTKLPWALSSS